MGSNDDIFMARYSAFNPYRIRHSDMGYQKPIGYGDAVAKSLYCGMKPIATWISDNVKCIPTGGVFNLEFSPEGSLLVAACEKRSIQIFDPLTHKSIHSVAGAHMDCVNCVKFLDARMFATCSDDTTIALWDVRNLKKKIRSLFGHSKWVKNIEFSVKDKLLVTSGLDGSIYTWDINSYTESNLVYQRVFHTASLMRCRLSPDARQMVMCTTGGLIVIIHDLNLETLAQDLHGFKPNLYRLMQMSNQVIPIASMYDHLFDSTRKENRVEFVSDFPEGNDAEVVSALQIHPQGWSALSRNISHDDRSEWTCIHDIQPADENSNKCVRDSEEARAPPRPPPGPRPRELRRRLRARLRHRPRPPVYVAPPEPEAAGEAAAAAPTEDSGSRSSSSEREQPLAAAGPSRPRPMMMRLPRRSTFMRQPPPQAAPEAEAEGAGPSQPRRVLIANAAADAAASRLGRVAWRDSHSGNTVVEGGACLYWNKTGTQTRLPEHTNSRLNQGIQNDVWEASITLKQHRLLQEIYSRGQVRPNFNMQRITGVNTGITPPQPAALHHPAARPSTSGHAPAELEVSEARAACPHYIRQNRERLLYYIEETNEGKGFIKELCYSSDGRIVCSPFGRGMRLLALNDNCSELNHTVSEHPLPRAMHEVGHSVGRHQDLVVCSKFSPRYHLLVTGCLEGRVVWYQPHSGENW